MGLKFTLISFILLFNFYFLYSQEYPISRFYTYGKTPFEIVCLGMPDIPKEEGEIIYQRVFEIDSDKKNLHGIALKYIGESYKSAKSVIDINDSESGLILVKGTFIRPYSRYYRKTSMMDMIAETSHNLKFEIKDNRIRVSIYNLSTKINDSNPSDFKEFITAYNSKDGLSEEEEDFRFKANIGLVLNIIHNDVIAFMEGINVYFEKELKDDW